MEEKTMAKRRVKMSPTTYVDLTHKEIRNSAWWQRRKETLRNCRDDQLYTQQSLNLCWRGIQKSKRFKRVPWIPSRMPSTKRTSKWHRQASRLPDKYLKLDPKEFPYEEQIPSLVSTVSSFTDRLGKMIDQRTNPGDSERAFFDSLSFPIIYELLCIIKRYYNRYQLRIPKETIPDNELLKLSMTTLQRARQFFEYFYYKKSDSAQVANRRNLQSVLEQDCTNIDMVITVVQIFLHKCEKPNSVRKKRPSECILEDNNKRIKITIANTNERRMVRKFDINEETDATETYRRDCHSSFHAEHRVGIKQESRELTYPPVLDTDTEIRARRSDQKRVHVVSEEALGIRSNKMATCKVPTVTIKHDRMDTWIETDYRSLSEFE